MDFETNNGNETLEKTKIKQIQGLYQYSIEKWNKGDFKGALEIASKIKDEYGPHYYVSNIVGGLLIDLGGILRKEEITREGIELIENDFEVIFANLKNPGIVYYNLSNGYYVLFGFKWEKNPYFNCFKETELDKVKHNLRKALEYGNLTPQITLT